MYINIIIVTLCNWVIHLWVFSFLLLQLLVVISTEMTHPFLLLWLYNQFLFPHRRQQSCRLHLLLCLPRVRSHHQHLQVTIPCIYCSSPHSPIYIYIWSYCSPPSSKLFYCSAPLFPNVLDPIALHPSSNVLDLRPITVHPSSPMYLILLLCTLFPNVLDPIALYRSSQCVWSYCSVSLFPNVLDPIALHPSSDPIALHPSSQCTHFYCSVSLLQRYLILLLGTPFSLVLDPTFPCTWSYCSVALF